jgi:hypothetical protein
MKELVLRNLIMFAGLGCGMLLSAGCRDTTPPPPMSSVPPVGTYTTLRGDTAKPLPASDEQDAYQPPFQDQPLVTQAPPEQPAFVQAYQNVGRPRIALFVNRTFAGEAQVPPTTPPEEGRLQAGASAIELSPPARIDYDAIETIMTDWFSGGGKVTLVSAKLSEAQVRAAMQGAYNQLKELSDKQNVDVLIFVRASETKQTPQGVALRLVAESVNTVGGESIGRAVVDTPPFLEKQVINEYTRYTARKLMKDMTDTWNNAPAPRPVEAPAPTTQPQ